MTVSKITSPVTPLEEINKINEIIDNLGGGGGGGSSRNIGEIIQSTIPLTDAGLHLLDGSLISGSGSYSAFVTYIAGLVLSYPDLFETEANWQTSVTNYGVCGKFVYDSVNNTVRLPKLYSNERYLIKSYSSGTDWYRIYSDGWCEQGGQITANFTGTITFLKEMSNTNYFISATPITNRGSSSYDREINPNTLATTGFTVTNWSGGSGYVGCWMVCGYTDISDYNIATQYNYIVIATTTKTDIQVDIDEIATDLNGKVDKSDLAPVQCVIETYNSGTDWYRVWSDGWIEQGGRVSISQDTQTTVTLLKAFSNTDYMVLISACRSGMQTGGDGNFTVEYTSASQFKWGNGDDFSGTGIWYACGY